ncbi:MAG: GNAT family N-acetyltransferase [Actinomycetes bacterium]
MLIRAMDRLGDLSDAWNAAVRAMPHPSPFLLSWWVDHAATHRPVVLCCFEGDELVGGAAFEVDHVGRGPVRLERVRLLGQGPLAPDHLDVIGAADHRQEVAELVTFWLQRAGQRIVDLDGLSADGALAAALTGAGHVVTDRIGAPWAALPASGDEYLAARPGQLRSTAKRARKRLDADGATIRTVDAARADEALADLARLHDGRWADESEFLRSWKTFERAAVAGMRDGSVIISELVAADGDVVATELDLATTDDRGRRTLAFYQAGRRTEHEWRGAGTALRAAVIGAACDVGVAEYDLLRGDESYKSDWASERRELLRIRFGVGRIGTAAATAAGRWKQRQDRRAERALPDR